MNSNHTVFTPTERSYLMVQSLPPTKSFRGFVTGVGSRKTPNDILELCYLAGALFYTLGYVIRSGGAQGADAAFERGVLDHPYHGTYLGLSPPMEIYLPWARYDAKAHNPDRGYINALTLPYYPDAQSIADSIHPIGEALRSKQGAHKLHTRNIFQVLGADLHTPSQQLWCWAKPSSDGFVQGGTRTAVVCAIQNGIPVHNLYEAKEKDRLETYLQTQYQRLTT